MIGFTSAQGCIRITGVNPSSDLITITNFTGTTADISSYRMCSLFNYATISSGTTIISGDPAAIPDGESIVLQWSINDNAADVGLYLPTGSFSSSSAMIDFMQYGNSGLGRESVAGDAGLWTAGTFVNINSSVGWMGSCSDHSATNWISTNLGELSDIQFEVSPNPVDDAFKVKLKNSSLSQIEILIYSLNGQTLHQKKYSIQDEGFIISTAGWEAGTYILRLNYGNGNFGLKKLLKR